jgi:hypothetical protein
MNAGLTNLATLRANLLPGSLGTDLTFNRDLLTVGQGVAGLFETHCNRKFQRVVNDVATFAGDRMHYFLPRYPIEAVTKLERRWSLSEGWVDAGVPTSSLWQLDEAAGQIRCAGIMGSHTTQVRVTYTGGYWWETYEPDDAQFPVSLPQYATALPEALRSAFLMQCDLVWDQRDKLNMGLVEKPQATSPIASVALAPMVIAALSGYIRYQIS